MLPKATSITAQCLGPRGYFSSAHCPLGLADVLSPSTITAAPALQRPSSALTLLFCLALPTLALAGEAPGYVHCAEATG